MKRFFHYLMATNIIMLIVLCLLTKNSFADITSKIKGDVDNDFKVTAKDAQLILRKAGKLSISGQFIYNNADFNGDGKITATDARLVLRIASGELPMLVDASIQEGKNGKQLGFNGAWCAQFVTKYYNIYYNGVLNNPKNLNLAWCDNLITIGIDNSRYYHISTNSFNGYNGNNKYRINTKKDYIPKQGDLIFFDWNNNGYADHVGFVIGADNNSVTTLEGNSGNKVAKNSYSIKDQRIMGYFLLNKAI